ncbi:MAG: hypothetical protein O8C66_16040 [Candidatus Methanoperedens sp.]|nr:hypothetical protein [Candidatus Methanoperedens sp.]MCZ7372006.1 hypothetical protein [Candidatus Methanoperedens sp.]
MVENNVIKNGFFTDERDVTAIEMGRDDVIVSCTQGKIMIWFGRQATEQVIRQVIFGISNADSSVNHEQEVICSFSAIADYENIGYVLTSYAKTRNGYRAIFNIPFSKKFALVHFVKSIEDQLKQKDVRKTFHWDGSKGRILQIYNELKKLEGWEIKRIDYKVEGEKGV